MFENIYTKYGLTKSHLASLLSKTEKSIDYDLVSHNQLSDALVAILTTPSKLLKLLNDNNEKIPVNVYKKAKLNLESEIVQQISKVFKGTAFVKQVKSNELGFRNGIAGKAGSFILIPKNCLEIFPNLSENIENDKNTIRVCIEPEKEMRELEFTYHNSRISLNEENGRDEYRLYNNNFINGEVLLSSEDIVIIIKATDSYGIVYNLYRFRAGVKEYEKLLDLIVKYKNGRAFATMVPISEFVLNNILFNEVFELENTEGKEDTIEEKKEEYLVRQIDIIDGLDTWELSEKSLDELSSQDIKYNVETVLRTIKKIKRDVRFRRAILSAYENKCAITKVSISHNGISNIQACHIIGKAHGGSDNPTNGIALDMNLHWAFDKGMFTINDSYEVEVHPTMIDNELLRQIHGKKILLPKQELYYPSKEALEYHRIKIFGGFLK